MELALFQWYLTFGFHFISRLYENDQKDLLDQVKHKVLRKTYDGGGGGLANQANLSVVEFNISYTII